MKGFTDRLAEFLRSVLGSDGDEAGTGKPSAQAGSRTSERFVDPDLQQAWNELDDYMNTGRETPRASAREQAGPSARGPRQPDESLRQDYVNLEVPFGASLEDVKSSYKKLMMRYHPDMFAGNPEKQRVALEITKKVNQSFEKIRSNHEGRSRN
jgi:DnaJ-class molecular chaperone